MLLLLSPTPSSALGEKGAGKMEWAAHTSSREVVLWPLGTQMHTGEADGPGDNGGASQGRNLRPDDPQ